MFLKLVRQVHFFVLKYSFGYFYKFCLSYETESLSSIMKHLIEILIGVILIAWDILGEGTTILHH